MTTRRKENAAAVDEVSRILTIAMDQWAAANSYVLLFSPA